MMSRWIVRTGWLSGTLAVLLIAWPAQAQRVDARLSTDSATVGDRFTLTLTAEHPFRYTVTFPVDSAFGDLEVLAVADSGSRYLGPSNPGIRIDSIVYEVTTFALDTAAVPAIPVQFRAELDSLTAASAPLVLPVTSLVPEDAQGIRDLAPLAEFPRSIWPYVLLALAALTLLGLLLYYLRRRRQQPAPEPMPEPPPPPISPYDEALRRLRSLETTNLGDETAIKPYFVELSDVLRTYLEHRLHVPALERTTRELMHELESPTVAHKLPGTVPNRIRRVLNLADLVKFADIHPPSEDSHAALDETRQTLNSIETKLHQITAREPVQEGERVRA